eukprot:11163491-Lingulodinium_polyedra.AAC.1
MKFIARQQAKADVVAGASAGYICSLGAPPSLPISQPDPKPGAPPPPGWAHGKQTRDRKQQQKYM